MTQDIYQGLNKEQRAAVESTDGPVLVVAGAGTGKTMVITRKLAHILASDLAKTNEILALTFTEKAAQEMEERVDKLLPYGYLDLWISTFHSFAERVLKDHALDIGIANNFKIFTPVDCWLLMRQNLDEFDLDYWRPRGNPTKFIRALVDHFARAKDEGLWPQDYLDYAEKIKLDTDSLEYLKFDHEPSREEKEKMRAQEIVKINELANAYHVYQKLLLDRGALDFGDLINYTLKLLSERPHILAKYRDQFKYILVDEFQDTNWAQYELIKMLAAPRNNLTAVGDDDQSIYKFRGASLSNILQFKQDYPDSQEVILVENFRSRQNILDMSYEFIQQNNPNRLEAQLKNKNLKKKVTKKLKSRIEGEAQIAHLHFKNLDDEVAGVVSKIVEIKSADSELSWNDFAILTRSNDAAAPFCNYLSRHELPYQFLALKGLYTRPVVIDILSFFKLLDNYHESPALFRVMSLSIYNIAEDQLIELNMEARQASSSLWQVSTRASSVKSLQPETVKSLENVVALVERASKMARAKNVGQVFKYFLEQSGYLHWLDHLPEFEKNQKLSWLEQFWRRIKKFETDHEESRLSDFMNEIDFELEAGEEGALKFEPEEGPEMIQILTIHGAKGLEFKHVFAVNMVDRRFPTIERKEAIPIPDALVKEILTQGDAHLEEERRLFYVAMTRAKHNLYFTSADDYGGLREKKLSRFLIELGYTKEKDATRPTGAKLPIFEESVKAEKPAKIKYKLPAKFSFTRLVAFRTCPLQYKYAHILKIPVFGSGNMSFGRSMHNTLERFFREWLTRRESEQAQLFGDKGNKETDESKPGLEELISIYDQEWISSWYEDENEMRKRKESGKKALTRYWEVLSRDWPNALVVEQAFNLKLGDYILKGRIDRVDQLPNGNLAIVDYKTGKARRELASEDKEQLLIYQMALEDPKLFGKKVEKLVYYYLEEGCDVEFVGKEKDMDKLKESVIRRIEQIKESEFAPKPSELCKHCDFASICDYRKL